MTEHNALADVHMASRYNRAHLSSALVRVSEALSFRLLPFLSASSSPLLPPNTPEKKPLVCSFVSTACEPHAIHSEKQSHLYMIGHTRKDVSHEGSKKLQPARGGPLLGSQILMTAFYTPCRGGQSIRLIPEQSLDSLLPLWGLKQFNDSRVKLPCPWSPGQHC